MCDFIETDFIDNESELQFNTQFILCIEEFDIKNDNPLMDTRLFIGYNTEDNHYFVRGNRQARKQTQKEIPYAFKCNDFDELYNFIDFVVGKRQTSLILYNFNNLVGRENSELTYEFFETLIDKNYEVAGYDKVLLKREILTSCLRILKHTYNL